MANRLPYPYPPMWMVGSPAAVKDGWLMNCLKDHIDDPTCKCANCYVAEYPFLTIGPPVQVHDDYLVEKLGEMFAVGLYDKRNLKKELPCSVCGEPVRPHSYPDIPANCTVKHLCCVEERVRELLVSHGYTLDYVVMNPSLQGHQDDE